MESNERDACAEDHGHANLIRRYKAADSFGRGRGSARAIGGGGWSRSRGKEFEKGNKGLEHEPAGAEHAHGGAGVLGAFVLDADDDDLDGPALLPRADGLDHRLLAVGDLRSIGERSQLDCRPAIFSLGVDPPLVLRRGHVKKGAHRRHLD